MLIRALLILLIVLNLGVAIWWVARGDDAGEAPIVQPEGVARLRLLSEGAPATVARTSTPTPAPAPAAATPPPAVETLPAQTAAAAPQTPAPTPAPATPTPTEPTPPTTPAPAAARCFAFGPFESAEQAKEARAQLQSQVMRLHERTSTPAAARGWRVTMAVPGNRDAAQAVASRIAAAGFDDFFITADGDASSVIALGRYGSERAARSRESALHAAGFTDARAEPLGGGAEAQVWIDVLAPTAFEANAARRIAGASRADAIDCAKVP